MSFEYIIFTHPYLDMHTSRTCCGVKAKTKNFSWWYLCAVPAPVNTPKKDYYYIIKQACRLQNTQSTPGYNTVEYLDWEEQPVFKQ